MGKKHCSLVWYYYVFSVDKRHWHEFGIITCFLWIKGTGLSLVLLRVFYGEKKLVGVWYYYVFFFFVDKRQCSEFGIISCFLWIKGTFLSLVLLRVFLWIKGTGLSLVLFRVFCG